MQDPNKLHCTQIAEMLGAFRDMELEPSEMDIVEVHLLGCAPCRQELVSIEMIISSLKSLPELPVKDFADAIEARINQRLSSEGQNKQPTLAVAAANVLFFDSSASHSRKSSFRNMAAVAALLLVGFIATIIMAPKVPTEVAQVPGAFAGAGTSGRSGSSGTSANQPLATDKSTAPLPVDIVALYDEEGSNNVSDVGISTNEDGLYAIKM